jgi:hypothetical protein
MKLRIGFVSNSSSCSFYCPRCEDNWEGWDWDDPAVCPRCDTDVSALTKGGEILHDFGTYLCNKYKLNFQAEVDDFLNSKKGEEK